MKIKGYDLQRNLNNGNLRATKTREISKLTL
jgi:hypothetical protein